MVTIALAAPNALQLLTYTQKNRASYLWRSKSVLERLMQQGFVERIDDDTESYVRITPQGENYLLRFASQKVPVPKRWDGKWRMVIFDIPERRRSARDQLRQMLVRVGFTQLQNSVWVFPYDSEDLIMLIKTQFVLGKDVLYVVAGELEGSASLRRRFNLR